ncbi:hypothetical protein ASJ81_17595 [Methanosarcina spelaei]|uniref:Uncharacterized protein n=1 Tax=Methanosarcina spelaei TaxID=1036679 RepID=A0A2A2HVH2_9EURY|nr:hypothetical protein ASJ81_17595 [Methanosarcina spelaei]
MQLLLFEQDISMNNSTDLFDTATMLLKLSECKMVLLPSVICKRKIGSFNCATFSVWSSTEGDD